MNSFEGHRPDVLRPILTAYIQRKAKDIQRKERTHNCRGGNVGKKLEQRKH